MVPQERGTLVRGLAHPFAVGGFQFGQQQDKPGGERATSPLGLPFGVGGDAEARKRKEDEEQGTQAFASFLKTFGAVPVNGSNLYSLLALGETALLYPGGVREVRVHGRWCNIGRPARKRTLFAAPDSMTRLLPRTHCVGV